MTAHLASDAPIEIAGRPFAVDPITGLMTPDGIFDAALFEQQISFFLTNSGNEVLRTVEVFLEAAADPGIVITPDTLKVDEFSPGASILLSWRADFRKATPGKHLISVRIRAAGFALTRKTARIFVSRTTQDPSTGHYLCEVPEGTLTLAVEAVQSPQYKNESERRIGPWFISRFSAKVTPRVPYTGVHGELPFQDPWWKVVAAIVAFIAGLAGIIAALVNGGPKKVGVTCTFDNVPNEPNSPPTCKPEFEIETVAGVCFSIASGALTVALQDDSDPWFRGQEKTAPTREEETLSEETVSRIRAAEASLVAGTKMPMKVEWSYERRTDRAVRHHAVRETSENGHLMKLGHITAPKRVVFGKDEFIFSAFFRRPGGRHPSGPELYAYALVASPSGRFFRTGLYDDGRAPDDFAGDGTYTGRFDLAQAAEVLMGHGESPLGKWAIYVIAQDVNLADPQLPPLEAARTIGGFVVVSPFSVAFGRESCPGPPDAVVEVT